MEHNYLCNFGNGYYEIQLCGIILKLGQWFRGDVIKKISYLELLREGIMGNIHVK